MNSRFALAFLASIGVILGTHAVTNTATLRRSHRRCRSSCFLFLIFPALSYGDVPVVYSSSARLTLTDTTLSSEVLGLSLTANKDVVVAAIPHLNVSTGAVLVFDRHNGDWLRRLTAADGKQNDFFGNDLDIDGDKLIVGTNSKGEAAYVYDISTGQQLRKFVRPFTASDAFGVSVAIKGNLAVVGDPADSVIDDQAGAAYVLDISTGNVLWTLRGVDNSPYHNFFGNEVAIDENYAYIGSTGNSYVYQFDLATGAQVRKIRGGDTRATDHFGSSIAVDNGRFLVGAFDHNPNSTEHGSAYLFDSQTGAQLREFLVPGTTRNDAFGYSVDLSADSALIGAPTTRVEGISSVGVAYLFNLSSPAPLAKFQPSELQFNTKFGFAVKLDGTTVLISSPGYHNFDGAVYIFEVPEPPITMLVFIGGYSTFLVVIRRRHARVPLLTRPSVRRCSLT